MKTFSTKRKAFTLIELLIVIAIIGILFIVLISKVDFATDKAKISGVQTDFRSFQVALHTVATENQGFTDDIDMLIKQVNKNLDESMKLSQDNDAIKSNAKDPWGNNYNLIYEDTDDTNGIVTIISAGSDQKFYTKDDIAMSVKYEIGYDGGKIVVDMEGSEYCPHSYSDWTVLQDMTCTTDEIQERKCNYCGLTETSVINTTGHNFVDGFCTECSIEEIPAGLYLTGSNYTELLYTWQELIDMKLISGTTGVCAYGASHSTRPSQEVIDRLSGDLKFPNDMTHISTSGFSGCKNITGLMFTGKAKSFSNYALSGCSGIKNIYVNTKISWSYNALSNVDNFYFKDLDTFLNTTYSLNGYESISTLHYPVNKNTNIYINHELLEELTIPDGKTSVGFIFTASYSKLKKVVLPESVTTISANAFQGCSGLENINLDNITHIQRYALSGTKLTNVDLPSIIQIAKYGLTGNELLVVNIGTSLEKIANSSIIGKDDFEIHYLGTLDEWSTKIYEQDRYDNIGITGGKIYRLYVNGQEITGKFTVPEHWTTIPDTLFSCVYKINDLEMHDNVETIGKYAFYKTNLYNVTFSNSLTTIGRNAFSYTHIENVNLPDSVVTLGEYAFDNCEQLVTFNITENSMLVEIGDGMFHNDKNLKSLFIPQYVKRLGSIIGNCYALSSFTFHENSQLEYLGTSFSTQSQRNKFDLYLPDSVKEISGLGMQSGYIVFHISENSQLEKIGGSCFERFHGELYIPKNVSYIADNCFGTRASPKVTIHPENTHFKVVDNCLIDIANKRLVVSYYNNGYAIIPTDGSVTTLGAYSCDKVQYIPKIITSINSKAFRNPNLIYHYITYEGTVEEFRVLVPTLKLDNVKSITCSDGVIDASGNVTYN